MATGTPPPNQGRGVHDESRRIRWLTGLLVVLSTAMVALGVFQFAVFLSYRDTQDCLVQVATQGGVTRQAAIDWAVDFRRLVAQQPASGARTEFLNSIDSYIAELRKANVKAECLSEVDNP